MPDFPDLDHWLPQVPPTPRKPAPPFELRHAVEADLAALDARLRDWRDDRSGRTGPGRTWFRHFGGTSWLAEASRDHRPLGLLLGFRSADRPDEAVIHLVAVDPEFRRRGSAATSPSVSRRSSPPPGPRASSPPAGPTSGSPSRSSTPSASRPTPAPAAPASTASRRTRTGTAPARTASSSSG